MEDTLLLAQIWSNCDDLSGHVACRQLATALCSCGVLQMHAIPASLRCRQIPDSINEALGLPR